MHIFQKTSVHLGNQRAEHPDCLPKIVVPARRHRILCRTPLIDLYQEETQSSELPSLQLGTALVTALTDGNDFDRGFSFAQERYLLPQYEWSPKPGK